MRNKLKNRIQARKQRKKMYPLVGLLIISATLGTAFYLHYYGKSNEVSKQTISENLEASPAKTPTTANVVSNVSIIITNVGDCTLGSDPTFGYPDTLPAVLKSHNNDYSYFFKNVSDIFKKSDLTIANLETTFTTASDKAEKAYTFKGDPQMAKALALGGINAVNLSNNHIYDFKQQGFNDTIAALKNQNINYFGEKNIWITEVKGVKFGFLGYIGWSSSADFLSKLKDDILKLKAQNCIVIINFHWGVENAYFPNQTQKDIAHAAIDNGADLIIGHHPHVIEGIEVYKNRAIFYSLGNFCFGGNQNPADKNTFIAQTQFNVTQGKITSICERVIPCRISSVTTSNNYCPTPLEGDKKNSLLVKINELSLSLGFKISDNFTIITENK